VKNFSRKLSLVFSSGCLGGLANSVVLWLFGKAEITMDLGVRLAPAFTAKWLYPRLIWGGIWGFLFILPIFRNQPFAQGLFFSLGPSIVQLFVIFPYQANKGLLGLDLGTLTPLFVLFFNAIWGLTAALWLRLGEKN
jgi:hypothetical protein